MTDEKRVDDDWSEIELRSLRTLAASVQQLKRLPLPRRTDEHVLSKLVQMDLAVPHEQQVSTRTWVDPGRKGRTRRRRLLVCLPSLQR